MPTSLERVQPGDLISSVWMNQLLDALDALGARVEALEGQGGGAGTPVITGFIPTGDVPLPARLTIQGRNFLVPVSGNTVLIDGQAFTDFKPGSGQNALVVDIPGSFGVLPREALVTVVNRNGSAQARVRLREAVVVPVGEMHVRNRTPQLPPAQPGQTYTYTFELKSETNVAETYELSLSFSNVQGGTAAQWMAASSIEGPAQRTLQPSQPQNVSVHVTVPLSANRADFVLAARSLHNHPALSVTSEPVTIAVGQAQDPSDPRITLSFRDPGPASGATLVTIDGMRGIQFGVGTQVDLTIVAEATESAMHRFEASAQPAGIVAATPDEDRLQLTGGGEDDLLLHLDGRAVGTARVRFDVFKRTGNSDAYRSYITIPVRVV